MSPAHVRIAQLVKRHGVTSVEKKLGVSDGTVRKWLRDGATPQKRIRELVAKLFDIDVEAWAEAAYSQKPSWPTMTNGKDPAPGTPVEKPEAIVEDADNPRANAEATLKRLRSLLLTAEVEDVPRLAAQITSASRLLARLSGQLEVTEAQILRSAAWAKLLRMLRDVLARYPGAATDLEKAIAEYEAA